MINKTVDFDGYDGKKYSEEYYFHMSKADLAEMKLYLEETGLDDYFRKITASSKASEVLPHFKDIIRKSIGRMSEDGKRFLQVGVWEEFIQTPAYSAFFMWLLENPSDAAKFFTGILPEDLGKEVAAQQARQGQATITLPGEVTKDESADKSKTTLPTFDDYTQDELLHMPDEEFELLVHTSKNIPKEVLQIGMRRSIAQK